MKRSVNLIWIGLWLLAIFPAFPVSGIAYEEKEGAARDSSLAADTLPKAIKIDVSAERISVQYQDGRDTLILRALDRSAGGVVLSPQNNIIAFGKNELIDVLDSVRGTVFILFGDLEVRGYVKGDIIVALGETRIRSGASVEGPIKCYGRVTLDSGTQVWGNIQASELICPSDETWYDLKGQFEKLRINLAAIDIFRPQKLGMMLVVLGISLLLAVSISAILPRPIARIRLQMEDGFIKCFLVGVLLAAAILPVFVLILISIIGIPIAILIYPFVVSGALVVGSIGFAQYAGFLLGQHTTLRYPGYILTTIAGVILISSPMILATFFRFINLWPIAWVLHIAFLAIQFIMYAAGLGAVFFSRFGTRPKRVRLEPRFRAPEAQPDPDLAEAESDL